MLVSCICISLCPISLDGWSRNLLTSLSPSSLESCQHLVKLLPASSILASCFSLHSIRLSIPFPSAFPLSLSLVVGGPQRAGHEQLFLTPTCLQWLGRSCINKETKSLHLSWYVHYHKEMYSLRFLEIRDLSVHSASADRDSLTEKYFSAIRKPTLQGQWPLMFLFLHFYKIASLRQPACCTIHPLKCTVQWLLLYSELINHHYNQLWNISSPPEETPDLLAISLQPFLPALKP